MTARKVSEADRLEHRAFYEWITANFSTRYAMGKNFTGRHFPNIGFGFPINGIVRMAHRSDKDHFWFTMDLREAATKRALDGTLSDSALKHAIKHADNLRMNLLFWKENIPGLIDFHSIGHDLRQITALTLVLNYQIPPRS